MSGTETKPNKNVLNLKKKKRKGRKTFQYSKVFRMDRFGISLSFALLTI